MRPTIRARAYLGEDLDLLHPPLVRDDRFVVVLQTDLIIFDEDVRARQDQHLAQNHRDREPEGQQVSEELLLDED